jgi:hypothetical protein
MVAFDQPYEFADFPIRTFDRPPLWMANLVSGNVDAATRALFSPMSLSPAEMKTVRTQMLGEGRDKNPIMKTAVDLATHPLIIAGLVMAMGPWGKIAKPAQLHKMIAGGGKALPGIPPINFLRKMVSPLTSFRNIWHTGFLRSVAKFLDNTSKFNADGMEAIAKAVKKYNVAVGKPMGLREQGMVSAWLEAWNRSSNPVSQAWYSDGFKQFTQRPIIPGLQKHMSKPLLKLAQELGVVRDKWGEQMFKGKVWKNIAEELAAKGVVVPPEPLIKTGYLPRVITRQTLEMELARGGPLDLRKYELMIREAAKSGRVSPHVKLRSGFSLPEKEMLESLKDIIDPEYYQLLHSGIETARVNTLKDTLTNIMNYVQLKVIGTDPERAMKLAKGAIIRELHGARSDVGRRLIGMGLEEQAAERLASQLVGAAAGGYKNMPQVIDHVARTVGAPPRYSMRAVEAFQHYVRSMAPTYGWFGTGANVELAKIKTTFMEQWQRDMWDRDLLPMMRGFLHPREYYRRLAFNDMKSRFWQWLNTSKVAKDRIPNDARRWLMDKFSTARGSLSESTIGGKLAHLYYASALGLNLSPTMKNLFQNYITTMPMLGPRNMAAGLERHVVPGLTRMAKDMSKGVKGADAFRKAFPEYHKIFGHEAIMESMLAGDIAKEGLGASKLLDVIKSKGWRSVHRGLMGPFAGSEKFNRLWSFYSAMEGGVAGGLKATEAMELGRFITQYTQFTGGPFGLPNWLRGRNPLFRQFMHFPTRFMEYLYGSMRMGPEGAFSLGTLGRGLMASTGAYVVGKNILNMDLSPALMFSAMPFPQYEGSPFYPFPMVPPAVGVAGQATKALFTGEFGPGEFGKMVAINVPGGLAARRAMRALRPRYAGYRERTTDGRIPVYNDQGFLVGSYTPMQMTMRAMGLWQSDVQGEQQMVDYLLKQRDRIRYIRRQYLEALLQNDLEKAKKIHDRFARQYPQLGPITVKKSDIRAVRNRKQISRVYRVLKGFPKDYRPLFQSMVEQSAIGTIAQDAEADISALEHYQGLEGLPMFEEAF